MELRLLGPLEVRVDGRDVPLGPPKQRALLAVLALGTGSVVSVDWLIDRLWGEDVPASAAKMVQLYVSRLRRALADAAAPAEIVTRGRGYELRIDESVFDVARCRALLAVGDARGALALWRGPPLADLRDEPFAAYEIAQLDQLRLRALQTAIEADLVNGRHLDVLAELDGLVTEYPMHERLHGLRMLALYRAGRQADALEAYQRARQTLVDEIGTEPQPELRRLHDAILHQDPGLSSDPFGADNLAIAAPQKTVPSRVPTPPNTTIGRVDEVRAIVDRLHAGDVRLLTLTGPGGVGKTRLALEAARGVEDDFTDGACFVELATVARPDDMPAVLVCALEIAPLPGERAADTLARYLPPQHLLLVLDNFEHLIEAGPWLATLLARAPRVTVLTTSRERLAIGAEHVFPIGPLSPVSAGELFTDRARALNPSLNSDAASAEVIDEICRRVDCLPLAIELAASRCGSMSVTEIADDLGLALGPGARDAPERHQTIRAAIDWSHALLDPDERTAVRRFAVFSGGATPHDAEHVTGVSPAVLRGLVDKSLLVREGRSRSRYTMLETVRAYADERLADSGEADIVRERHAHLYLQLAESRGTERALHGPQASQHLAVLDAERGNLDAALLWALDAARGELALALVAALGEWWFIGHRSLPATIELVDRAIHAAGTSASRASLLRALLVKTQCLFVLGHEDEQTEVVERAESLARDVGDPASLARIFRWRSLLEGFHGRQVAAAALADEACAWAQQSHDPWIIAVTSCAKAGSASTPDELRARVEASARLVSQLGAVVELIRLYLSATYLALCLQADDDAASYIEQAMPVVRSLDDLRETTFAMGNLGLVRLFTGDLEAARRAFRAELELSRRLAAPPLAVEAILGLAAISASDGDCARAARLVGATEAHTGDIEPLINARLDATFFAAARRRAGAAQWDTAVAEGRSLALDDAIAECLADPDRYSSTGPTWERP